MDGAEEVKKEMREDMAEDKRKLKVWWLHAPVAVAAQRCCHPPVAMYGRSLYALQRPTSYVTFVRALCLYNVYSHTKSCQQQVAGMAIIACAVTAWPLHDKLHVIPKAGKA